MGRVGLIRLAGLIGGTAYVAAAGGTGKGTGPLAAAGSTVPIPGPNDDEEDNEENEEDGPAAAEVDELGLLLGSTSLLMELRELREEGKRLLGTKLAAAAAVVAAAVAIEVAVVVAGAEAAAVEGIGYLPLLSK